MSAVAKCLTLVALLTGLCAARALAQPPSEAADGLTGTVTDESGGVMQAVAVRVFADPEDERAGKEPIRETATDARGSFSVALPPGMYRLEIAAPSFVPFKRTVTVGRGSKPFDVVLAIDLVGLTVEVTPSDQLLADTTMSLTSTTLSGDDLLDLPRSDQDLAEYLMLLAGADITGDLDEDLLANFIIDGFEGGRLPSPDQIAQIIIDPGSLRADGRGPRIEIVTRPGTGTWSGSVDFGFADEALNARTPGERRKEPRQTRDVEFEARGPLIANLLEVTFELSKRTDERAADSLRAITPAGNLFSGVVRPEDEQELEIGARVQLNTSHRVDIDFAHETGRSSNRGVGGFLLPERGSEQNGDRWTFQISERMFRPGLNNNVRLQVSRRTSRQAPVRDGFAIDVADAFMSGGGTSRSSSDEITARLDDNLRWERGAWNFEWAGQLQYRSRRSIDRDNYNGTFEFASLHDYCRATGFGGVNCATTAQIVNQALAQGLEPIYLDARGRETSITGVPTTFTQAFGNAELAFSELAFDTHIQANHRFGQQASLGLGLQYNGTSHSRDFLRFNPTVSFQYRVTDGTVVSAGARLSFQDFGDYERLLRNDGSTHETELSISSPSFPDPFQGGAVDIDENTASLWMLDPDYRSPYTISPQISLSQQIPGNVRLTLSYDASRGTHQRRTPNVNAPYPGTPLPETLLELPTEERQDIIDQMRPLFPYVGNVTQIQSTGRSVSRTARLQIQPRGAVEVFGLELSGSLDYSYRWADDDNDFNNPYVRQWGPSRRDHQVQSRFRITMPETVDVTQPLLKALARATYEDTSLNFRLRSNTGRLYSVVTGRDLNGDQSTRDRPPGMARNTEVGPGNWNMDMTLTKDFDFLEADASSDDSGRGGFGGRDDGARLRFQARVNNLLNRSHPRAYGSVLTSPLFGLPTGYTGGRTISLSMNVGL